MDVLELLRAEQASKQLREPLKEQYSRICIDLGEIRADEELHLSGDSIAIGAFNGSATETYFKVNHKHSREIYPAEIEKYYGNFGGIFLTNKLEAGKTLVLYIGRNVIIDPAKTGKVKYLDPNGINIALAHDSRFISATCGNQKTSVAVADTAVALAGASQKVRWAILAVENYDIRWLLGGGTPTRATAIGVPVTAGGYITIELCDLKDFKFVNKNAGAAELPTINATFAAEQNAAI